MYEHLAGGVRGRLDEENMGKMVERVYTFRRKNGRPKCDEFVDDNVGRRGGVGRTWLVFFA